MSVAEVVAYAIVIGAFLYAVWSVARLRWPRLRRTHKTSPGVVESAGEDGGTRYPAPSGQAGIDDPVPEPDPASRASSGEPDGQ